ncbi:MULTISPECIES: DUF2065 family protein [Roseinatronobacter]|uniref:DUF2065 domain-containing protein n=1 Tax=Roseinatronobacter domitianus TaxID=2940293 RepID=A0ABT0LZM9_9RHOB|nr:DUF2065 domain-containing protein [Roseibaca sp.]MCL1628071.1 DUF2065 domain-containing protein [Roseibaca domitiana]
MTFSTLFLALGLVLILEGLVFALAPSRIEDLLKALAQLPEGARRLIGALALVAGGALITLSGVIAGP